MYFDGAVDAHKSGVCEEFDECFELKLLVKDCLYFLVFFTEFDEANINTSNGDDAEMPDAEIPDADIEDFNANVMILILHQRDRNLTLSEHEAKDLLKKFVFLVCFFYSVLFAIFVLNRHNGDVNVALEQLQRRSTKKMNGVDQKSRQQTITDDKSQTKAIKVYFVFILLAF